MKNFSIVIVCKNEVDVIGRTLKSMEGMTDDIVVYDSGSTDGTQALLKTLDVQFCEGSWEGFGKTKNNANLLAKYEWVVNLDADEAMDEELRKAILECDPDNDKTVYDLWYKNFLGERLLKYGEWGTDHHIRVFNRKLIQWQEEPVHEQLILPSDVVIKRMDGYVLHYTMKDVDDYSRKMRNYAMLNAEKYFLQGKKASWIKLYIAPCFAFFKYYILKRGFLDGYFGFVSAKMTANYTFLKYARLKELWINKKEQ